jgi:Universal stress protein UspA and related nucleotide-binding proteins
MKVLIAIDGTECSSRAIEHVLSRSWHSGDEFKIVSVVEPQPIEFGLDDIESPEDYQSQMLAACTNITDKARQKVKRKLFKNRVSTEVLYGRADEQIVNSAWDWPADLIVIGTHGHSDCRRFLDGSVAEFVTRTAPCSVEIVKVRASAN